ncbi:hypothetical protein EUGRSUZ_L03607 [Eucalyptus grandis]|uniref:Uncharacterized protein n=1 Tax=Eucalyptus grandis TaxID=71139 RepID=A0AAD9T755_EUCGR|nr:hypothetical protein EUGRSUZ_L03607 [Eucalyptus grandis]
MIDSWGVPFRNTFHDKEDVHLYEVSFIDSWLLCRKPIKRLLLRIMRKPRSEDDQSPLRGRLSIHLGTITTSGKNSNIEPPHWVRILARQVWKD